MRPSRPKQTERVMENQIRFVSAEEGNLVLTSVYYVGETKMFKPMTATNVEEAAQILFDHNGFAESAYFLSSMDFASENGFADDGDAKDMLERAVDIAKMLSLP